MNPNYRYEWHNPSDKATSGSLQPINSNLEPRYLEETLRYTRAELEHYRRLYEDFPSIYFTLNRAGVVLTVNQFGAASLGYTTAELIQQPISGVLHQDDRQRLLAGFTTLSASSTVESWEFRLVCQNSNILWVNARARTVYSREHPVIFMVCEAATAALAPLVELKNLKHLKDEFLSTVSHELRTPVTNMKIAIQMLAIALNQERDFLAELAKPPEQRSKAARYFRIRTEGEE